MAVRVPALVRSLHLAVGLLGMLTLASSLVGVPVLSRIAVAARALSSLGVIVLSAAYHTRTLGSTVFHRTRDR